MITLLIHVALINLSLKAICYFLNVTGDQFTIQGMPVLKLFNFLIKKKYNNV